MKKQVYIIYSIVALLCVQQAMAQQWLTFSQLHRYKTFVNPATTGEKSELNAVVAHRSQYTFLSPRAFASQVGAFSMPIFKKQYGVGIKIVNDFIGYQRYTHVVLGGAYHLSIKKSTLSFGLEAGMSNLSINGTKLRAAGGNYEGELVVHNDENIPHINVGAVAPNFSFGIQYSIANFSVGAAVQNINSPQFVLSKFNNETKTILNRTINIHSAYVIEWNKVKLTPMLYYFTDLVKHQLQAEILTDINNIFFSVAFRGYSGLNNDALIGTFGVKIKKQFSLAYSYDYNISGLGRSNYGSHEISINYIMNRTFKTKNKGNLLFNPRFL